MRGRIGVRIDGGGGDDTFVNASGAGASRTAFYDARGENRFDKGNGAHTDERSYERPPGAHTPNARFALDWGMQPSTIPIVMLDRDLGAFLSVTHARTYFGYRRDPFAARHSFSLGLTTGGLKPFAAYTGAFRRVFHDLDAAVHAEYSGIDTVRFTGFGNDTEVGEWSRFYKVVQNRLVFAPAIEFRPEAPAEATHGGDAELGRREVTLGLGPIVKYSRTPADANRDRFINSFAEPVYGTGSFGQVGAQARIEYDTRDRPAYPTRGVLLRGTGAFYPGVWDVTSAFGSAEGALHAYLTARVPTSPTLALRAGGKKVFGSFPFHESAFLGGPGFTGVGTSSGQVRGVRKDRFAGDASLYGNAELRLALARFQFLMPGEVGVFVGADTGRVFWARDPDAADRWHTGIGGGIWFGFLERRHTVSIALIEGAEMMGLYLRAGFLF